MYVFKSLFIRIATKFIAIIVNVCVFFTTRRGVLRFYRFLFLAESKFVLDLTSFCSRIYLRF